MGGELARCRSCNAEILWAVTERGARTPFDAKPLLVFQIDAQGVARAFKGHQNHFATCPNANQHRKTAPGSAAAPGELERVECSKLTTRQMVFSLTKATVCPACEGAKYKGKSFCMTCFGKLDTGVQGRLYRDVGRGYEPALLEAMRCLGRDKFAVPGGGVTVTLGDPKPPAAQQLSFETGAATNGGDHAGS